MKKISTILITSIGIFVLIIVLFFYFISLDDGSVVIKNISTPVSIHISDEYVYLVSLQGLFTEKGIQKIQSVDNSIQYILKSGHERQHKSDKEWNFRSAKKFIDISEHDFSIVKKIKIKGTFITSDLYYDIVSDKNNNHYLRYSPSSLSGNPDDRW